MCGICSTHAEDKKRFQNFDSTFMEGDDLKRTNVDDVKMEIRTVYDDVNWI
jgi:hypothetical protein